ncbi:MAG: JAB domain-containing protein [Erythrobacter sp.]
MFPGRMYDQQLQDNAALDHTQGLLPVIVYLRDLFAMSNPRREHFHAIFLDRSGHYLDDYTLQIGDAASLSIRMRELFSHALQLDARGLVIAHNHPSGHCQPSARDIASTREIVKFAKAVDIALLDHLIITPTRAYSMRAGGLL